jgi:hypothetical protein
VVVGGDVCFQTVTLAGHVGRDVVIGVRVEDDAVAAQLGNYRH